MRIEKVRDSTSSLISDLKFAVACHGSSLDLTLGHVTADIRVEGAILAHSEGATHRSRVRLEVEYKLGIPLG
jgi:hypothetical protein